jgi:hypothetical protein
MRTLRLSLVGMVILVLLGAPTTVVGQSPTPLDPMRAGGATITFGVVDFVSEGTSERDDTGTVRERGTHVELAFSSSDPRLSGDVTYLANLDKFGDGSSVHTETYEVVNDDGRWFGTSQGMEVPGLVWGDSVLLRGEGGYEGLSALLWIDGMRNEISAVIFPGEMPPLPEPVGPAAE